MLGPTTHQNCSKHPMYCHTHPLYYPTHQAYTPISSLEQKNTDSSTIGVGDVCHQFQHRLTSDEVEQTL